MFRDKDIRCFWCLAFVLNTGDKEREERVQRDERDYIEMTLTFFQGNKEKYFQEKENLDKHWQWNHLFFIRPVSKRRRYNPFIFSPKVKVHLLYSPGPASRQQGVFFRMTESCKNVKILNVCWKWDMMARSLVSVFLPLSVLGHYSSALSPLSLGVNYPSPGPGFSRSLCHSSYHTSFLHKPCRY